MDELPSCIKCGEPSAYDDPCRACQGLSLFDADGYSERLLQRLTALGLTYRDAAPLVGVSPATLNRVARGFPPEVETYLRINRWMSRTYEAALAMGRIAA